MDWYCAVWNSNKVNNEMGAQILYEKLCKGDNNLVVENDNLQKFYEEVRGKSYMMEINKGEGYVILSCEFNDVESVNDLVQSIAKKYNLSFYDPQNIYYINYSE